MSFFDFGCDLTLEHARTLGVAPANDNRSRKTGRQLLEEAQACPTDKLLEWIALNTEAAIEADHYERSRG